MHPKTMRELEDKLTFLFGYLPQMEFDNEGQVVIYSDLQSKTNGTGECITSSQMELEKFVPEES